MILIKLTDILVSVPFGGFDSSVHFDRLIGFDYQYPFDVFEQLD